MQPFDYTVIGIQINIPIPPPKTVDSDWHLVPDEKGNFYLVNVDEALINQPKTRSSNAYNYVHFELYTIHNPRERQLLYLNTPDSVRNSNYDASKPTRFVVHGWNSIGHVTDVFCEGYFEDGHHNNVNFIAVNWQAIAVTFDYVAARYAVNDVGAVLAKFIDFLAQQPGNDLEKFLVMGHSLGAHVAGIAGKLVTSGKLPRIIAFDPAFPLFKVDDLDDRVAIGDARLVEIIHTAAGILGFSEPLGNKSFYPNGGTTQPGCGVDLTSSCSHGRSYEYYIESINSQVGFGCYQCSSYEELLNGKCNVIGDGMVLMGGETRNDHS